MNRQTISQSILHFRKLEGDGIKGFKITLLGIFNLTCTYGTKSGDHLHLSFGILRWEMFGGLSIWISLWQANQKLKAIEMKEKS